MSNEARIAVTLYYTAVCDRCGVLAVCGYDQAAAQRVVDAHVCGEQDQ